MAVRPIRGRVRRLDRRGVPSVAAVRRGSRPTSAGSAIRARPASSRSSRSSGFAPSRSRELGRLEQRRLGVAPGPSRPAPAASIASAWRQRASAAS